MKLFLNKSNKGKYKVAQRVLSFKKKTRLTVMNMHSNLLNSRSVHHPLSAGRGVNLQPNFQKKGGGRFDRTSTFRGDLLGKRVVTLFGWEGGLQFSHKNKSKYQNLNI